MHALADSQAAFAAALTDPARDAPGDVRRPEAGSARTRRFDVYRNNVAVAAIDALADIYPAVLALVGEEFFRAIAKVFFEQERPASPVMHRYGANFAAFLDGFPPAQSVPYLGDVARLEFARLQAYNAADAEPLNIAELAGVPPDRVEHVILAVHPSAFLIRSRFPVVSLWGASAGLGAADDVDMSRPEDGLVLRPGEEVVTVSLPEGGAEFLAAVMAGRSLGDAAAEAAGAVAGFDLSVHLSGLFGAGCFAGLETAA